MVCDARAYSFQIFIRILADSYLIRKSSRQMIVFRRVHSIYPQCVLVRNIYIAIIKFVSRMKVKKMGCEGKKNFATVTPFRVCVTVYRKRISSVLRSA